MSADNNASLPPSDTGREDLSTTTISFNSGMEPCPYREIAAVLTLCPDHLAEELKPPTVEELYSDSQIFSAFLDRIKGVLIRNFGEGYKNNEGIWELDVLRSHIAASKATTVEAIDTSLQQRKFRPLYVDGIPRLELIGAELKKCYTAREIARGP